MLKALASRFVPKEVIYRQKRGFAIPSERWWRGPLQPAMRALMSESTAVRMRWIRAEPVLRALEEHRAGVANHETRLWQILALELWARVVVERTISPGSSLGELVPHVGLTATV
jgi:asparagine synthase (glutamine-hydrolysing)